MLRVIQLLISITNDTVVEGKKIGKLKSKYFVVKNYRRNDREQIKEIKSFAFRQLENDFKKFSQYDIYFYRYTSILNEKFVETENDELAWHTQMPFFISHGIEES